MLDELVIGGKTPTYGSQLLLDRGRTSCGRTRIFGDPIFTDDLLKSGNKVGRAFTSPARPGCPVLTRIDRTATGVLQERVPREQQSGAYDVDRPGETNDEVLTEREHRAGLVASEEEPYVPLHGHKHRSETPRLRRANAPRALVDVPRFETTRIPPERRSSPLTLS